MIKDIPNSDDFIKAGKAQFDFAWDIAISFLMLFDEARDSGIDIKKGAKQFWESAKQRIQTALAITQQGVELIIKGKIVQISPYLLIAGTPSDWPKPSLEKPLSFSDFRTIDAQDLVKTHNLFSDNKLTQEFINKFNSIRNLRNRVMHTVDNNLKISALEVITKILEMHDFLMPNDNWVETRNVFLLESPVSLFFSSDDTDASVSAEFFTVFSLLSPAQVKKFFGIDKKHRTYICPECKFNSRDYNIAEPKYAVLKPNTPGSTALYCFVCNKEHTVTRKHCSTNDCKGNVISDEYNVCCSCGKSHG